MTTRHPIIVNLVIYAERDGWLFDDLQQTDAGYRAERLRQYAGIGCMLPALFGAIQPAGLPGDLIRSVAGGASQTNLLRSEQSGEITIKLSVNGYNHPELHDVLASTAPGTLSSRIKMLAMAGMILQRIARGNHSSATREQMAEVEVEEGVEQKAQPVSVSSREPEPEPETGYEPEPERNNQSQPQPRQKGRRSSAINSIKM